MCILDGWGLSEEREGNAVALADTPNFDWLMGSCPNSTLVTHGEAVGLPAGCIGNSEVGHLHIGAGRTVLMEMQRITHAIRTRAFQENEILAELIADTMSSQGNIHLVGIVSEVGVHGLASHLLACARVLYARGMRCQVHAITDGRDDTPGKALEQIAWLEKNLPETSVLATVSGRYYTMDRDKRWDRVERAWHTLALGEGMRAESAQEAVTAALTRKETDEFITPTAIGGYGGICRNDGVFFTNYRSDRMRQIVSAVADPQFRRFDVTNRRMPAVAASMVSYFDPPRPWISHVFERPSIENTLGQWVARHGKRQFRLAETEKYPHVTYFLNGGREAVAPGELRSMPQSPMVSTYDLAPEMAVNEVGAEFVKATEVGFDLIVVNLANPDMVGHTGNLSAATHACEATDRVLGVIVKAVRKAGGRLVVAADHGNCEKMLDAESGGPHTAHTTNPVPVILYGADSGWRINAGTLSDLAPTILDLMNIVPPPEMTGKSLIVRHEFKPAE